MNQEAATQNGRGPESLWYRLLGGPCRCCKADVDAVAVPDDLPTQVANCDDDLIRGNSHKSSQASGRRAQSEITRSDKRRWTDTSVTSNADKDKMGLSLNEFAVVHRAARSLQKAVAQSDQPTAQDLDRGVHVENIYDFYDPEVHKVRVRKMDDTVLHTRSTQQRHTNMSLAATLLRLKEEDQAELLGNARGEDDDTRSEVSAGSNNLSSYSKNSERSLEDLGMTEKDMLRKEAMAKLRRVKSVVDTEATANWGHIIGKVLHRKVLDFNAVKDKAIRKRRFEDTGESVPLSDSSNRTGVAIWLSRLQGRCKAIAAQALDLSKRLARWGKDVMDHEWDDPQLLTHLFSTEYFDTLMLLANAACKLLAIQPPLVAASAPCRVFGDLHGQLRDLLLYFHAFGMPGRDETTFVFNGDFVDRGQHQLETVGLLLALKVLYPEKVYLIRGNHEDRLMNEKYGFKHECMLKLGTDFGKKMFDLMQSAFDRLPLACLIANRALVLHGGIGDGMWGLSDIWNVARPLPSEKILSKENSWLFNILWSDPIEDGAHADPNTFGVHPSPSSTGKSSDVISVMKTAEITKVVASTIMTQTTPHSALSPITVATAAAQCLAVTLTTTTATTKMSTLPSPKKGKKHEDGWKEVVRRSKKMSVSSSVISRVIGRGGCNINAIRETTGAHIDIDTNRQKTTGSCIVTIKGPADATRQAHQLISALVKDPECDINDVLPRKKHLHSQISRSAVATTTTITTSVTSTVSHHRTLSEPKPTNTSSKGPSTTQIAQTKSTTKTTTSAGRQSLSSSWPSTNSAPVSHPAVTTSVSTTTAKSTVTTSTHMPSTARWASTTQTASSTSKKTPLAAAQVAATSSLTGAAPVASAPVRKPSGGNSNTSSSSSSGVVKPPTPAKRQLFPETPTEPIPRKNSASKTSRVVKGSPSYSSVAMGVTGGSGSGALDITPTVTTSSSSSVISSVTTSPGSSNLPPVISNILSHVGQTFSPSVWNDIAHPSARPSVGPVSELDISSSVSPADPITQPLYITTPGALFTPLPHEATSSSPPHTSGSPVPTTTPSTSTSPNSSPLGTSLASGNSSLGETGEKPSLRPIGTERASRRVSASPLPSVPGISPLIGTEGTQVAGVWSYSYTPDSALSTGWSAAPSVSTAPAPSMISGNTSLPGSDEEQFGVNPGDTLQTFLERLSLSSHLSLFQKNEIDLDALLLMSEKDYADIGLPKGPRVKLLNSTRQIYTSETSEFSSVPAGASPGSRPVGRNAGWNPPGGIIATSSTATTVAPGVPFGAKRAPGRKVDPNKRQGWKSWSRTAV